MFRRVFMAAMFATLVAVPALAGETQEPHAHWCMLSQFQVTQVGSVYADLSGGRGINKRFIGAQLFVPAQPGLTAEWIKANLSRHSEQPATHRSFKCPLDLPGTTMNVVSGGTGFWIQITSNDEDVAHEILERARQIVR